MIITLPIVVEVLEIPPGSYSADLIDLHLVVKDLGFPGLRLRNQRLIEDVQYVLADALQLRLDLLAIFANSSDMLICTL